MSGKPPRPKTTGKRPKTRSTNSPRPSQRRLEAARPTARTGGHNRKTARQSATTRPTVKPAVKRYKKKKKGFTYEDFKCLADGIVHDYVSFLKAFKNKTLDDLHPRERQRKSAVALTVSLILIMLLSVSTFAAVRHFTRINAVKVYLNQVFIGTLGGAEITASDIYNTALAKLQADAGEDAVLEVYGDVTVEPVHAKKADMYTIDHITREVYKNLTYKIQAAVIYVESVRTAVVKDMGVAALIEENIKSEFLQDGINIVSKEFVEDYKVVPEFVDKSEIISPEEAKAILTKKTDVEVVYEVISRDNLSIIADKAGMSLTALLALNPDVDPAVPLQINQKLLLHVPRPLLSVKTTEQRTYQEVVPKKTEYVYVSGQPKSYTKVVQQGRDGQLEITAEIYRINGFEEGERQIVSERTILEPITEIIEVGTGG